MKRHLIILAMVLVIGGCGPRIKNLTKEGLITIDTAIEQIRTSHDDVLDFWAKNSDFILAYVGDDLGDLSWIDYGKIKKFTKISKIPRIKRTETQRGKSMKLEHEIAWAGIREALRLFAPELLLLLPGL